MRCTPTDTRRYGFQTLPNSDHKRAINGRTIDPITRRVLCLQAFVTRGLQKIRGEHTILVWADSLTYTSAIVGVFSVAILVSSGTKLQTREKF